MARLTVLALCRYPSSLPSRPPPPACGSLRLWLVHQNHYAKQVGSVALNAADLLESRSNVLAEILGNR
jgi:hypothetical protein